MKNHFMNEKIVLTVLIGLVVVSSGCLEDVEGLDPGIEPEADEVEIDETGEELVENSLENFENSETYRAESKSEMLFSTSWIGIGVETETDAEFDRLTKTSQATSEGEMNVRLLSLSNGTEFKTDTYVTENKTLVETSSEDETREEVFETGFTENPFVELGMLEGEETELLGEQQVTDTDTYVVSVDTDIENVSKNFGKTLNLYADSTGNGTSEPEEELSEDDVLESDTYLWISQENYMPVRLAYHVYSEVEDDENGLISFDGVIDMYSDTRFYGYGEETGIDIPEDRPEP